MDITVRNKSLFFSLMGLMYVFALCDDYGNVLSYECFMTVHNFPIPFK